MDRTERMGSEVQGTIGRSSLSHRRNSWTPQKARGVQIERYIAVFVASKRFVEIENRRGARDTREIFELPNAIDKHSNTLRGHCGAAAPEIDHAPMLNLNRRFRSCLPEGASSSKMQRPPHRKGR
ncbi:hypothetical protein GB937_003005 [Aspergillus fischeri]|nr:hypothetical protein GB937_003005 [Aspergillus fischeri]